MPWTPQHIFNYTNTCQHFHSLVVPFPCFTQLNKSNKNSELNFSQLYMHSDDVFNFKYFYMYFYICVNNVLMVTDINKNNYTPVRIQLPYYLFTIIILLIFVFSLYVLRAEWVLHTYKQLYIVYFENWNLHGILAASKITQLFT